MKLIKPSYEIMTTIDREEILKHIEKCGRTCYKSEDKITEDSASKFVQMVVRSGHESVIEHYSITVKFICDRGVSHELVRHRIASYSQESTRYCNYSKDKFDNQLIFIIPCWFKDIKEGEYLQTNFIGNTFNSLENSWVFQRLVNELEYNKLIDAGWKPQQARSILPNSLKTEIVMTANLREWKWVFFKRCALDAHPQMRELMIPLRDEFIKLLPEIYQPFGE